MAKAKTAVYTDNNTISAASNATKQVATPATPVKSAKKTGKKTSK